MGIQTFALDFNLIIFVRCYPVNFTVLYFPFTISMGGGGESWLLQTRKKKRILKQSSASEPRSPRGHVSKKLQMNKQWSLDMSRCAGFDLKHRSTPAGLQSSGTHITLSLRRALLLSQERCFSSPCLCSVLIFLSFCMTQHSAQVAPRMKSPLRLASLWLNFGQVTEFSLKTVWPVNWEI